MGQLPLQDTRQFRSFSGESKLDQSRGQLKETNRNHNKVPIAVRGSSLFMFLIYVKLTVVSWVCSRPMCAEMKVWKKVIKWFGKRKFEQAETYGPSIMRLARAEIA